MAKIKSSWRYYFIVMLIITVIGLLLYRLSHMQTVEYNKLKKEGDNRSERTLTTTAYRGMISDRNGKPLAISTPVDSIWVDPFFIKSDDLKLLKILSIIELSEAQKENIILSINAS
jgi:cell division protein FtsI (penicillin-binding protein 3)